jgi:hypothetical protein
MESKMKSVVMRRVELPIILAGVPLLLVLSAGFLIPGCCRTSNPTPITLHNDATVTLSSVVVGVCDQTFSFVDIAPDTTLEFAGDLYCEGEYHLEILTEDGQRSVHDIGYIPGGWIKRADITITSTDEGIHAKVWDTIKD